MRERGEFHLLTSIGKTETAADLAITGAERVFNSDTEPGIAFFPFRIELRQEFRVTRTHDEFEIFALREKLRERLLAQLRDDFRRWLIAGEQSTRDFNGQAGQRLAELRDEHRLHLRNLVEDAVTELLDVRSKFHHLLVSRAASIVHAAAVRRLRGLGDFGFHVNATDLSRCRDAGQRPIESNEFGERHVIRSRDGLVRVGFQRDLPFFFETPHHLDDCILRGFDVLEPDRPEHLDFFAETFGSAFGNRGVELVAQ